MTNYEHTKRWRLKNPEKIKAISRRYLVNKIKRWSDWVDATFEHKCEICGYSKCRSALNWHHVNPDSKTKFYRGVKQQPVSLFTYLARSTAFNEKNKLRYLDETKKCVRLCANCHAEVHAGVTPLPIKNSQEGNLYV